MRYLPANTPIAAHWIGYTLPGGTWSSWTDSTGNGNTQLGQLSPGTTTVNGLVAPTFDGSTQFAAVSAGVCGATAISIATVSQSASLTSSAQVVAGGTASSAATLYVSQYTSGSPTAHVSDVTATNLNSTNDLASGSPYFIGAVNNGSSSYVQLSGTVTTGPLQAVTATQSNFTIGALDITGTVSNYFGGSVEEVVVWCGAISQTDMGVTDTILKDTWGAN